MPGNITDEENQIALVASSSDGLELQFQLTNRSFSELINVIITLVTTSLSTEQGWLTFIFLGWLTLFS